MKTHTSVAASLFLCTLCLFNLSCSTGEQKRLNCICLIDFSGSLSKDALHGYIHTISSDILQNLDERDRLVVLPIDEGAKTEAVKLIFIDMAEKKFSFPSDGFTHARDRAIKRIREYGVSSAKEIEKELEHQKEARQRFTYYTDIFSALEQAAMLIEKETEDSFWRSISRFVRGSKRVIPENMIVLLSDMIHESGGYTFAKQSGCDEHETNKILDELKKYNAIPDLSGCKVFINGRTGRSNLQVENIHRFWVQYFKESKGELLAYDYDSGHEITSYLLQRRAQGR